MFTNDDWEPGRMMDGYDDGRMMDGGGDWFMLVVGILLVALIGAIVFWALRMSLPRGPEQRPASGTTAGSARDVLDHRLARGEVTPEEYGTLRTLLDP